MGVLVVPNGRAAVWLSHHERLACVARRAVEEAVAEEVRCENAVVLGGRVRVWVEGLGLDEVIVPNEEGRGGLSKKKEGKGRWRIEEMSR